MIEENLIWFCKVSIDYYNRGEPFIVNIDSNNREELSYSIFYPKKCCIEDAHVSSNVPGTQKSLKNNIIGHFI